MSIPIGQAAPYDHSWPVYWMLVMFNTVVGMVIVMVVMTVTHNDAIACTVGAAGTVVGWSRRAPLSSPGRTPRSCVPRVALAKSPRPRLL